MAKRFELLKGNHSTAGEYKDGKCVLEPVNVVKGPQSGQKVFFSCSDAEAVALRQDPERFREVR